MLTVEFPLSALPRQINQSNPSMMMTSTPCSISSGQNGHNHQHPGTPSSVTSSYEYPVVQAPAHTTAGYTHPHSHTMISAVGGGNPICAVDPWLQATSQFHSTFSSFINQQAAYSQFFAAAAHHTSPSGGGAANPNPAGTPSSVSSSTSQTGASSSSSSKLTQSII